MINQNNTIQLCGRLEEIPTYHHKCMGEKFYTSVLLVERLSGVVDRIPVTFPGKLLEVDRVDCDRMLNISGQVRSYNVVDDYGGHLSVMVFVQGISHDVECVTMNDTRLDGFVCRPPIFRVTPFGRQICEVMLAVNRAFGKSDYIPCIVWGTSGRWASKLQVGNRIELRGRIQSREYQKALYDGNAVTRTAIEVSAFTVDYSSRDTSDEEDHTSTPAAEDPVLEAV